MPPVSTATKLERIGTPAELQPLFIDAGTRVGIDPVILAAQIKAESGFQNHPCRRIRTGATICGMGQMTYPGWGTRAQLLDRSYAVNRHADSIHQYLNENGGDIEAAWVTYQAGNPGNCGHECRTYIGNIYENIAIAEGRA